MKKYCKHGLLDGMCLSCPSTGTVCSLGSCKNLATTYFRRINEEGSNVEKLVVCEKCHKLLKLASKHRLVAMNPSVQIDR
jgi:hypothetical protein